VVYFYYWRFILILSSNLHPCCSFCYGVSIKRLRRSSIRCDWGNSGMSATLTKVGAVGKQYVSDLFIGCLTALSKRWKLNTTQWWNRCGLWTGKDVEGKEHMFQINQPTRCNSFSSLLLDVYVQLNMFRSWSGRPARPQPTALLSLSSNGKPEAATVVVQLLMMGVRTPETCWAVHKRQVINLRNCYIWLVDLFGMYVDARTCKF